jgi:hypothetical protein
MRKSARPVQDKPGSRASLSTVFSSCPRRPAHLSSAHQSVSDEIARDKPSKAFRMSITL